MSCRRFACATLSAVFLITACSDATGGHEDPEPTSDASSPSATATPHATPTEEPEPTPEPTPEPEKVGELTIVSGGDILIHPSVWENARTPTGFDFSPSFTTISDWITGADLALCSLEVPIAPAGEELTGYPLFGAPDGLISSLKAAGWDGCNLATNHTMDRGFAGVERTVSVFEEQGMGFAGAARSEDEHNAVQFYTLEAGGVDVDVAHISATTLTNGLVAPADRPWSWFVVGQLGPYEVEDVIDQATYAREQGADIVVVSMHWGIEYVNEPIQEQLDIGRQLAESGAVDLVYGNHAHVPQPIEKLEGGPNGEGMWTAWTMGNLLSGQTVANHGQRVTTGYLATATVEVMSDGAASVTGLDWTTVTQDRPGGDRLYALTDAIESNGTGLTTAELIERGNVTYPVMSANGSAERRTPPTPVSTKLELSRR